MSRTVSKIVLTLAGLSLLAVPAWAVRGVSNVLNTPHNLSSNQPIDPFYPYQSNVDEVCVFCHTPHGGILTGPLWNHSTPAANTFTHYNTTTLSPYLQTTLRANRDVQPESLICMACHDGSVAVDHLINKPNSLNGNPVLIGAGTQDEYINNAGDNPGARIGGAPGAATSGNSGDLTDDHPISFSYRLVLAESVYSPGGAKEGELRPIGPASDPASALSRGVRFYGSDSFVECTSCHDPHVDYVSGVNAANYAPFLITPNTGSALCLACHNK